MLNQKSGDLKLRFQFKGNSKRVDVYLSEKLDDYSRSQIASFIKKGLVFLNKDIAKKSDILKDGDILYLSFPILEESSIRAQNIDIDIVYEDSSIIVIDKKQNMVVHPGAGNYDGTLVNGILYHCEDLKGIGGVLRPGVVHRLDKDTSGIIVFAKNQKSLNDIARQFKEHSNIRKYMAIVRGETPLSGRIETFISRHPKNRIKFSSKNNKGKWAVTEFKRLELFAHFSLLEIELHTGRTHQIRVHFADKNHPLLGDPLYGPSPNQYSFLNKNIYYKIKKLKGQMLHAKYLEFNHPETKKRISFESRVNEDFSEILELLRKYDR